jgi:flagellar motor switch protein FliN/FliY
MTDTNQQLTNEVRQWFETWKACVEHVLSQVSGQAMAFEISADAWTPADSDLRYTVSASGAVQGEMSLRLSAESAVRLAQKFLGETEPSGGPSAEHKEALLELLRQVAGQAATAVGATVGGTVQLQLVEAPAASSWPAANTLCVRTRDEAGTAVVIEIQVSADLVSALQPPPEAQPATKVDPPATLAEPPPEVASYQRLMDVGLEVKIRFGSRRMALRDVLALSTGVVVELDSNVSSPVDLLLDGRTIAQGEVVVVDGKYGLRVTQVLDPRPPL